MYIITLSASRFHVVNMGNMVKRAGKPMFLPCTPRGIMELLRSTGIFTRRRSFNDNDSLYYLIGVTIAGKQAVVVGRSDIVVCMIRSQKR